MHQDSLHSLFQDEFSKMVAVISKRFGLQHIEIAEDIVSETFLSAIEDWEIKGMPVNPTAWLYKVAKQKTLYHFRRDKIFREKAVPGLLASADVGQENVDVDFSLENIKDGQLQMLFAVCTPAIAGEAQIGLALRILCGFTIEEIAEAFLTNTETITKRLYRARVKLRTEKVSLDLPGDSDIDKRLRNVLHIIYLLFNEGYYSRTQNQVLRKEFCLEAMRLCLMLTGYGRTNRPETNALMALMCFHAARFSVRQSPNETFILYEQQNKALLNNELVERGLQFLALSAIGNEVSSYHLEARISCWHCIKTDNAKMWKEILDLYDHLLRINYSPGVALNRLFALFKLKGAQSALAEAEALKMDNNYFFCVLMGELHRNTDQTQSIVYFTKAFALSQTETEKQVLTLKIDGLKKI